MGVLGVILVDFVGLEDVPLYLIAHQQVSGRNLCFKNLSFSSFE